MNEQNKLNKLKTSKKPKCFMCRKMISTLLPDIFKCKCGHIYCRVHLYDHNCDFNYHEVYKEEMELPLVIPKKIAAI